MAERSNRKNLDENGGLYAQEKYEKKKIIKPKEELFIKVTRFFAKRFASYGKGAKYTPEQADLFDFLDLELPPEEFYAAAKGILYFGVFIGVALGGLFAVAIAPMLGLALEDPITLLVSLMLVAVPLTMAMLYQQYPKMKADNEKMLATAYIPEIINYLVMSMRLNPNLEKAVEFAAQHGRGKIAEELKKIVWDVQIGKYQSVEEAIDELAYKWGGYNDDFKHSLMLIRASVLETDKQRRAELLEKASNDVLEGSKEKMDLYARQLHQPTVFLYYFGILLPLMLAILLPIGAAFAKGLPFANASFMFAMYVIIIPVGIYIYGNSILGSRPPTYVPPDIPEDFPGLPKKGIMKIAGVSVPYKMLMIFVLATVLFAGYAADSLYATSIPDYGREKILENVQHVNIVIGGTPTETVIDGEKATVVQNALFNYRIGQFGIFSILIATSLTISIYLFGKYGARKKVQDEIRDMESEFKDAIYVLASRLGENRPMEDALRHSIEFLPKSRLANQVFRRILENITMLGMTIDAAVYDETYGALKNLPSETIRSGMQVMVDSVEVGTNVAAKSLIALAMQIRNARKIDEMLKKLLEDITVMLNTMATFIAPIVLAVVSSLQTVIVNALSGVGSGGTLSELEAGGSSMGGLNVKSIGSILDTGNLKTSSASPGEFMLIIGIYVIEVVILLTYFNSQIDDSNNKLHTYTSIAKALPVATILFCVVAYIAAGTLANIG